MKAFTALPLLLGALLLAIAPRAMSQADLELAGFVTPANDLGIDSEFLLTVAISNFGSSPAPLHSFSVSVSHSAQPLIFAVPIDPMDNNCIVHSTSISPAGEVLSIFSNSALLAGASQSCQIRFRVQRMLPPFFFLNLHLATSAILNDQNLTNHLVDIPLNPQSITPAEIPAFNSVTNFILSVTLAISAFLLFPPRDLSHV